MCSSTSAATLDTACRNAGLKACVPVCVVLDVGDERRAVHKQHSARLVAVLALHWVPCRSAGWDTAESSVTSGMAGQAATVPSLWRSSKGLCTGRALHALALFFSLQRHVAL